MTKRDLMDEARTHQALVAADAELDAWNAAADSLADDPYACCVDCELGNGLYDAEDAVAELELVLHTLGV